MWDVLMIIIKLDFASLFAGCEHLAIIYFIFKMKIFKLTEESNEREKNSNDLVDVIT